MENFNRVIIVGQLFSDPINNDYNTTPITDFMMRTFLQVPKAGGVEKREQNFDVRVFNDNALQARAKLKTGNSVYIEGRIEDIRSDGAIKVYANSLAILDCNPKLPETSGAVREDGGYNNGVGDPKFP